MSVQLPTCLLLLCLLLWQYLNFVMKDTEQFKELKLLQETRKKKLLTP